ncbi:hypothetical protein QCA50_014801 [Cerrena zonata]|uniref:Transmembrane protein n=1 Tax=Cerrena zonata TaxID=2478898 RepID=A0AAW0FRM3_9APHY
MSSAMKRFNRLNVHKQMVQCFKLELCKQCLCSPSTPFETLMRQRHILIESHFCSVRYSDWFKIFDKFTSCFDLLAARYLFVAIATSWIWDSLLSLSDDIRMVKRYGIRLPDLVYLLSRISTFTFIIMAIIHIVTPISHCQAMVNTVGWIGSSSVALNNALFFIRLRGVYYHVTWVWVLFLILWFATLTTFTSAFGFTSPTLIPTSYCIVVKINVFVTSGVISTVLYDTAVFLAISFRLIAMSDGYSWKAKLREFMRTKDLTTISNILWSTGLLYYIPVITINLFTLIILLCPSIPIAYKDMCPIPEIALQNILTCRVFRDLKLGVIYDDPASVPSQQTFNVQIVVPSSSPPNEHNGAQESFTTVTMHESSNAPCTAITQVDEGSKQGDDIV